MENNVMSPHLLRRLEKGGAVAVIVLDDIECAVPLARALSKGGINAIELTLRTPAALDGARAILTEVPEMIVGIGTVINADQVKKVADIGAHFAVSPGCNPRIINAAKKASLSFAPGVCTPTDIDVAVENGCNFLKYFPAHTSGKLEHLESIAGPYSHLGIKFVPLGGVNLSNAEYYLKSPLISAVGGSWIAKRELIKSKQWEAITRNAAETRSMINRIRE